MCAGDSEGLEKFPLRNSTDNGRIEFYCEDLSKPRASWRTEGQGKRERLLEQEYIFAYGRYRRVQYPESFLTGGPELLGPEWDNATSAGMQDNLSSVVGRSRTATLTRPDNHLLKDISKFLRDFFPLKEVEPQIKLAWDKLNESVQVLGEGLEGVDVVTHRGRTTPILLRRGTSVPIEDLSDGYQAMLVIIFDLILRYIYLRPDGTAHLQRPAIVLVDEIDLHLHPRWQRAVVKQLVTLFPGTQFILTTHSAAVVQGAIDEKFAVVALHEEAGTIVPHVLSDVEQGGLLGAQIGSLLVEDELFGVTSRYSYKFEQVENDVRRLRRKLTDGTATPTDQKLLLRNLETLEELVANEEARWAEGPVVSELIHAQLAALSQLLTKKE